MRLWVLAFPLLLAASVEAAANPSPNKLRQYQPQEGKTLKDYINDGYEIKSITNRDDGSDFNYFLQKGADFVRCVENSAVVGGTVVFRTLPCLTLVQPEPY